MDRLEDPGRLGDHELATPKPPGARRPRQRAPGGRRRRRPGARGRSCQRRAWRHRMRERSPALSSSRLRAGPFGNSAARISPKEWLPAWRTMIPSCVSSHSMTEPGQSSCLGRPKAGRRAVRLPTGVSSNRLAPGAPWHVPVTALPCRPAPYCVTSRPAPGRPPSAAGAPGDNHRAISTPRLRQRTPSGRSHRAGRASSRRRGSAWAPPKNKPSPGDRATAG